MGYISPIYPMGVLMFSRLFGYIYYKMYVFRFLISFRLKCNYWLYLKKQKTYTSNIYGCSMNLSLIFVEIKFD